MPEAPPLQVQATTAPPAVVATTDNIEDVNDNPAPAIDKPAREQPTSGRDRPAGSPPPDRPPPGASNSKREPAKPPAPPDVTAKGIPVLVDAQVLRHNLVGTYTFESIAVKNGTKVQAGQQVAVISDGAKSSPIVAEAAGTLEELTAKVGDPCPRGRIFGRVASGLVRATIATSEAGNFSVGAKVTLKKKTGGTTSGTVVRINGPTLIIDPAPAAAQTILQLLVPSAGG
jgi:biotin carboxyl carrier protein